ncbi:hypothetical protein JYU29_06015 [Tianweitania sp. BSSL-BM11]|uniref:Uncharacterized protein n=1 Tax=Tianweitania aestuarii TaxID=2814886 RepID=A0ABS5RT64_9HYPH|nr:hypothetical protein [Tianweitania aestuarii]MBS9720240.1 hypothetical protein [Tianweitania aestuarii]
MTDPTIPVGGSTGLSHEHSAAVEEAARWLATEPRDRVPHPIVPALRSRFGLTAQEACAAIKEARLIQARAM